MGWSRTRFERFAGGLLDWLLPQPCAGCGSSTSSWLCPDCFGALPPELPPLIEVQGLSVAAAARYAPPVSTAIGHFKYRQRPDLARPLAGFSAAALRLLLPDAGVCLVPVPLHPRRLAERGYNQAALLAVALARRMCLRCAPSALARRVDTPHLPGRGRAERLAAVRGVFTVQDTSVAVGGRVILIDDVVTTGATALACARSLEAAGAAVLGIAAVARQELEHSPSPLSRPA